jgi:hypothetical protein
LDVNGSGTVSALDALAIINYLNSQGAAILPATNPTGDMFLDVNGDNAVSALDALQIINFLNSQSTGGASNGVATAGSQSLASPTLETIGGTASTPLEAAPSQSVAPSESLVDQALVIAAPGPIAVAAAPPASMGSSSSAASPPTASLPAVPAAAIVSRPLSDAGDSIAVFAQASESAGPTVNDLSSGVTASIESADFSGQPTTTIGSNANVSGLTATGRLFSAAVSDRDSSLPAGPSRSLIVAAVDAALAGFGEDERF